MRGGEENEENEENEESEENEENEERWIRIIYSGKTSLIDV